MPLFSESYRQLNEALHASEPAFGTNGHIMAEFVVSMAAKFKARTVLDYGCGKGTFKPALIKLAPSLDVHEYDIAIPEKSAPPSPADIVLCADVMEHIEPECLEDVIADLRRVTRRLLIVGVATHPAQKILADGRNAHLIVESKEWWLKKFAAHFRSTPAADTDGGFTGLFQP